MEVVGAVAGFGGQAFAAGRDMFVVLEANGVRTETVTSADLEFACSATFLEQPSLRRAIAILDAPDTGLVMLAGPDGSGRRMSCIRLLSQRAKAQVIELFPDWSVERVVNNLPRTREASFLLDVSDIELGDVTEVLGGLVKYGEDLASLGSRVVVMTSPLIYEEGKHLVGAITVQLTHLPASLVIKANLAYHDPSGRWLTWLDEEPLHSLIGQLDRGRTSARRAADLVQRILGAVPNELNEIAHRFRQWEPFLTKHLGQPVPGSARKRTLLLTAAVFNGFGSADVALWDRILLRSLGIEVPASAALELEGMTGRAQAIEAVIVDDALFIDLDKPDVDKAVVRRYWHDFPELRPAILHWLGMVADDKPTQPVRQRLAEVMRWLTGHAAGKRVVAELFDWLKHGGGREKVAYAALDRLLVDPATESYAQRRLYDLAKTQTGPGFVAVARLCSGLLARHRLPRALVRLRQLADRADTPDRLEAIYDAVRAMAKSESQNIAVLMETTSWTIEGKNDGGLRCLLCLLDPRGTGEIATKLIAVSARDDSVLFALQQAWVAILSRLDHPKATEVLAVWCEWADNSILDQETVTEILGPVIHSSVNEPTVALFRTHMTDGALGRALHWVFYGSARSEARRTITLGT